jgi:AcrR family transcriptional regulator
MADRPERVPADEVRRRMLDAGRAIALEAGVGLTVDHLRLEEVIARAEVPRSSVYRLWAYKDHYLDDLLIYLAGPGSFFTNGEVFDPETSAILKAVIVGHWHLAATLPGRRAIVCETVRQAAARNYRALSESPYWRMHNALIATVGSTPAGDARDKIAVALEHAQFQSRVSVLGLFGYLSAALGLRCRDPGRSIAHLVLAGGTLIQSLAIRHVLAQAALPHAGEAADTDRLLNSPVPGPGIDGEPADWTLAAFGYLAIMDAFTELDPDFVPPGSPPLWHPVNAAQRKPARLRQPAAVPRYRP